ncbi:Invasion gene expression up-regulator SirB [Massilia aurea]|uniref:Invasion gene expression up-regulator SirB n=1 Tax=Massilia aurea TaxID=373040 RepID=A0A422QE53_9BURK|nr:SirB2 family protein [Massilia aurea]RNF28273.1 Invasion gene expression up-regulator SirB [Massilia aurea]
MSYYALKHIHMTFAVLSGALFLVRGLWMLAESKRLQQRWVRIAPHVIDTLLLGSAIGLAVWSSQYPGQSPWLTAKLVALVAYIGLGTVALKRGRTRQVRALAFVGALACFAYILAVAVTKNPLIAA